MRLLKDKLFYGWVVIIALFIVNAIMMGTNTSFGVFFKSLQSEFSLTRATTSAVFSARMALGSVIALLGGWALDRYGPRIVVFLMGLFTALSLLLTSQANSTWQLFITFSLLLAVGSGASYVVVMSTVMRWFEKKRGMAVGIVGAGGGLGQVAMAPFAAYLILNLDWRMAYVIMGLIAGLILIPISRLLRKDPYEIGTVPDGEKSNSIHGQVSEPVGENLRPAYLSLSQALRTRSFWLILFIWVFSAFSIFLIQIHIVPHATDLGFSFVEAATILSLIGFSVMFGRAIIGTASDKLGRKNTAFVFSLLQVGAVLLLLWARDLWMFYLFALVHGFTQGGLGTALTALIGDIFGLPNVGKLMGVLSVGWAVGASIGPVIGGLIFDVSNSYYAAFLIMAVLIVIRPLLLVLIRPEIGRNSPA